MFQQAISPPESFFAACVAAGVEIDHHESDLYVPANDVTRGLLERFALKAGTFTSQIDGRQWYDVPFAYLPWWQAKIGG